MTFWKLFWRSALLGALVLFVVAGIAWACTPQPYISLSPYAAVPGETVIVNGGSFTEGQPVEIRWNDAGGPVVGAAQGTDFSVAVRVPESASPGAYSIVATQQLPGGQPGALISLKAAASLKVISGGGSDSSRSATTELWTGFTRDRSSITESPVMADGDHRLTRLVGGGLVYLGIAGLFAAATAGVGAAAMRRRTTHRAG